MLPTSRSTGPAFQSRHSKLGQHSESILSVRPTVVASCCSWASREGVSRSIVCLLSLIDIAETRPDIEKSATRTLNSQVSVGFERDLYPSESENLITAVLYASSSPETKTRQEDARGDRLGPQQKSRFSGGSVVKPNLG